MIRTSVFTSILCVAWTLAVQGQDPPSHDPSTMMRNGDEGRYFIFTTGDGIWNMSSDNPDFTNWRPENPVFPIGTYPDWIDEYVDGFRGGFWAPDVIKIDTMYYLYYSCAGEGAPAAIGLTTATDLTGPWSDSGMVVAGNNAIDPALLMDDNDELWMTWGNWQTGIDIIQLDPATGKRMEDTTYHLVNGNVEAPGIYQHGDYYYLFFQRGICCSGVHTGYRMQMARSTTPHGPYYDKDSVSTLDGGGSNFIQTDGRYIGPGHFGYGEGKLTYHYYDGLDGGNAKLKIESLEWEDGWPKAVYSRSGAVGDGTYIITNNNSNKVLDLANADTVSGTNVIQNTVNPEDTTQHWQVTYEGDGYYKISPILAPDKALEVEDCSASNGANVQLADYDSSLCQLWYAGRMNSAGVYRVHPAHSHQALEIVNALTSDGANVQQWPYNEHQTQRWTFTHPDDVVTTNVWTHEVDQNILKLYPNPSEGNFTIEILGNMTNNSIQLEIFKIDGKKVYSQKYPNTGTIHFNHGLKSGIYHVKVTGQQQVLTEKLMIK